MKKIKPAYPGCPIDLAKLGVSQLHALYKACHILDEALSGVSNQPRVGEGELDEFLDAEMHRMYLLRQRVAQQMRELPRPDCSIVATMWAEVIIGEELWGEPPEFLLSLAGMIATSGSGTDDGSTVREGRS